MSLGDTAGVAVACVLPLGPTLTGCSSAAGTSSDKGCPRGPHVFISLDLTLVCNPC